MSRLWRLAVRRDLAHQFARHGARHPLALRQRLPVENCDDPARGAERALDSACDIGDDMRLDLQLTVAEQLEKDGLSQLGFGGAEAHDRRETQPRKDVRNLQSPGVWTLAGREQHPCFGLERRVDEV